MDRLPVIAGLIVGLLLLVGLFSLIPPARCRDGWNSPSIGSTESLAQGGQLPAHPKVEQTGKKTKPAKIYPVGENEIDEFPK